MMSRWIATKPQRLSSHIRGQLGHLRKRTNWLLTFVPPCSMTQTHLPCTRISTRSYRIAASLFQRPVSFWPSVAPVSLVNQTMLVAPGQFLQGNGPRHQRLEFQTLRLSCRCSKLTWEVTKKIRTSRHRSEER